MAGMPTTLIDALIRQGAADLTIVSNNAGNGDTGLAALLAAGRVTKVICSFPDRPIRTCSTRSTGRARSTSRWSLRATWPNGSGRRGRHRRILLPDGVGTPLVEGKEIRTIDGRDYVLEYPIFGDVALIGAHVADQVGNLLYRKTARNFGPVMATAALLTVVEVSRVVDTGQIDPETVVTPGIYVDRVLDLSAIPETSTEAAS